METTDAEVDAVDLALVAFESGGDWQLAELSDGVLDDVETIAHELRRYPGDAGAVAMITVADDFALLIRVGEAGMRVLISDVSAAADWTLARSAVDLVGVHVDLDAEGVPAGDLTMLADLGVSAADLGALLDDEELYPDEMLGEIAGWIGLGDEFDALTGTEE